MQNGLSIKRFPSSIVLPRLALALLLGISAVLLLTSLLAVASPQKRQASTNIAGMLDPEFGTGGVVTSPIGPADDFVYALALQQDGKIVVLGETDIDGTRNYKPVIARYTTSGVLDANFGAGGFVTVSFGLYDQASDLAIQEDDKIVIVGRVGSNSFADFAVMRYTVSGTLDTSFGSGGVVSTSISPDHDLAKCVAIQEDGKIMVAGKGSGGFALVRYTVSGTLDSSFGTGGVVTTPLGSSHVYVDVNDMAIQSDGKIVIVGNVTEIPAYDFVVARYTVSGTLDASFGTGGIVTTSVTPDGEAFVDSIAIQEDGGIVIAGGSGEFILLRYTTTGGLDATFGVGGVVTTPIGTSIASAFGVAIQKDGKIVAVGNNGSAGEFAVVRYTASGALDSSFGTGGIALTDIGADSDSAFDVAIQEDGKIVAAGNTDNGSDDDFAIVRYYGAAPYSVFLPLVVKN